jgi:hypothetical protein
MAKTNVGSPKGRESYGDAGPVVVVGVTPHQGVRESRKQGKGGQVIGCQRLWGMRNACDMRFHVESGFVDWRSTDVDGVTSGQCPRPVPTATCVAGNGRVRSSRESPRVPVPSGDHRRGEGWTWGDYTETLDDASSA